MITPSKIDDIIAALIKLREFSAKLASIDEGGGTIEAPHPLFSHRKFNYTVSEKEKDEIKKGYKEKLEVVKKMIRGIGEIT